MRCHRLTHWPCKCSNFSCESEPKKKMLHKIRWILILPNCFGCRNNICPCNFVYLSKPCHLIFSSWSNTRIVSYKNVIMEHRILPSIGIFRTRIRGKWQKLWKYSRCWPRLSLTTELNDTEISCCLWSATNFS